MSLFCLCVIKSLKNKSEIVFFTQHLEMLARHYNRGFKLGVDWPEPIALHIPEDSCVISILDCYESDNCELFLLPDGWYINGQTNKIVFRERMKFLQDISNIFSAGKQSVEWYLGQSGTPPEEYFSITLTNDKLADYLSQTIGINGVDNGVHITIIS